MRRRDTALLHAPELRLLRIPPFPGAKARSFEKVGPAAMDASCLPLLRDLMAGGTFWGHQPDLPDRYLLCRVPGAEAFASELGHEPAVLGWPTDDCDPWHMLERAEAVICRADDEVRGIAALLGVPAYEPAGPTLRILDGEAAAVLAPALSWRFADPFGNGEISAAEAIELCGHWRRLIDANRPVRAAVGFAFWKQEAVGALLWGGSAPVNFTRSPSGPAGLVALWRSKAPAAALQQLEAARSEVLEVEDGFLRSQGLGADCVPPLSITVDRLGAYFDPGQPSELELLLQQGDFAPELLERARALREVIVAAGLGKYERGHVDLPRPAGDRRHILVPGQVEDDRSVQTGGCGLDSNLELLRRVRAAAQDAYLIYKPHPDVLAGHRKGAVPEVEARTLADDVATDIPISALLNMVDAVHVNTSLAGFEALLRGKAVTTHGVPFYAGWGLTTDLGPVPGRRSARRTLDELVAATLLLYPRYLDPVSGLPCPAEVVVRRLTSGEARQEGAVVWLRRLQGKVMARLRSWQG